MNNHLRISKCHWLPRLIRISHPSINRWHYINMKSCQSISVQVLTEYCFPFQGITVYCNSLHLYTLKIICHAVHLLINTEAKWPGSICDLKIYYESTLFNKFKRTMSPSEDFKILPIQTKQNCIWIQVSATSI